MPGIRTRSPATSLDITVLDLDSTATLALFDPARAKEDTYRRVYRQVTTGAYTAGLANKVKVRIESVSADDIGLRPSRLQIADILSLSDTLRINPAPKQLEQMMPKLAGIYEGLRIGSFEIRGLAVEAPDGSIQVGLVRFAGLENGKLGELAFEGLDARAKTPFRFARIAFKGFDIAGLLRLVPRMGPGQKPTPADIADLARLLDGIEVKQLVTPDGNTGKTINVDTVDL